MSILKTAIAARRWDLAAYTLVYAAVKSLTEIKSQDENFYSGEKPDAGKTEKMPAGAKTQ